MRETGRRGSAFVTVLAVLALLSILMELALQLVTSHLSETRRRGDAAYAGELARSGLAFARACVAAGGACDRRLEVQGGVIAVTTRRDGEMLEVTARGTVMRGGAEGPSREATTRVRPPEPGTPAPAPAWPPADVPPPPDPSPAPTPDAGPGIPQPPAPDPTTELRAVPYP